MGGSSVCVWASYRAKGKEELTGGQPKGDVYVCWQGGVGLWPVVGSMS